MQGSFATVQSFLGTFKPKDPGVRKKMGLSKLEAELFWLILSVVEDDTLVVKHLLTAAKAAGISPNPSVQINGLREKGYTAVGPERGSWQIKDAAVAKMGAIIKGENMEIPREVPAKKRAGGGSEAQTEFGVATLVQQVQSRLRTIDEEIARAHASIKNYEKEKIDIREALENMAKEMKPPE